MCKGIGFGQEMATRDSDRPLRGDGLTAAIKAAFADAECDESAVQYRLADLTGEQYGFKEAALAGSHSADAAATF